MDHLRLIVPNEARYVIWGKEVAPDTGTPHLQGLIVFHSVKSMPQAKLVLGQQYHVERMRGTIRQARDYCKKDGQWEEQGEAPAQGKRSDLDEVRVAIKRGASELEIAEEHFGSWVRYSKSFTAYRNLQTPMDDHVKQVNFYQGAAGTGKSRRAFAEARADGRDIWVWPGDQWFDGYHGQPLAIFDDYDGSIPIARFLKALDRYPNQQAVKGGFVVFRPDIIWITSNLTYHEWYPKATAAQLLAIERRVTLFVDLTAAGAGNVRPAGFANGAGRPA